MKCENCKFYKPSLNSQIKHGTCKVKLPDWIHYEYDDLAKIVKADSYCDLGKENEQVQK